MYVFLQAMRTIFQEDDTTEVTPNTIWMRTPCQGPLRDDVQVRCKGKIVVQEMYVIYDF